MADVHETLSGCFAQAQAQRKQFESAVNTNSDQSQRALDTAITKYSKCLDLAHQVSLFSPNESLEDVSTGHLEYFTILFHIAELILRRASGERTQNLKLARERLDGFLKLLDGYDMLNKNDSKIYERYSEDPNAFAMAISPDAGARRESKIARFKQKKALESRLSQLQKQPMAIQNDDSTLRRVQLTKISIGVHESFQSLESIAQELELLSSMPDNIPQDPRSQDGDPRLRNNGMNDGYSDKLDAPLSQLLASRRNGPILNQDGKLLKPFTLLDHRQRLQHGVFQPDHNLPTMTIDEYLEEERKRGGIIDGGGPQSGQREVVDEDDVDKADEATMKARAWDEFVEENPKGAGNRMNMG